MITEILFSALVMTTPLVLAGLGGLIHRRSGIVNVGLDGMMLLGALVALILASGGNWAVALVGAALSGHSVLTWIAWALVPLTAWVLTRTAQDGFVNGFDIVIAREATNSNRPHLAEASLEDIDRYMGRVVPLAEALEMLG